MTTPSDALREAARHSDGRFGTYALPKANPASTAGLAADPWRSRNDGSEAHVDSIGLTNIGGWSDNASVVVERIWWADAQPGDHLVVSGHHVTVIENSEATVDDGFGRRCRRPLLRTEDGREGGHLYGPGGIVGLVNDSLLDGDGKPTVWSAHDADDRYPGMYEAHVAERDGFRLRVSPGDSASYAADGFEWTAESIDSSNPNLTTSGHAATLEAAMRDAQEMADYYTSGRAEAECWANMLEHEASM